MHHGLVVDSMHMYEVAWVLCAVKLDNKASGVNLWGCTSFLIEVELKLVIDFSTHMVCVSPGFAS